MACRCFSNRFSTCKLVYDLVVSLGIHHSMLIRSISKDTHYRGLLTATKLFVLALKCSSSFSYFIHDDNVSFLITNCLIIPNSYVLKMRHIELPQHDYYFLLHSNFYSWLLFESSANYLRLYRLN